MFSRSLLDKKIEKHLPQGSFARNALTLMTGTAIAQVIPLAISPILTRLFTPNEFGLFALFISISSLAAVLATGRYDLPIMLPEKEEDAANLLLLSFIMIAAITPLLFVLIIFFNEDLSIYLKNKEISKWLYLVPFSVLFSSSYSALTCWTNRQKEFKRLSINRITCSVIISGSSLALGYANNGPSGLILGYLAGQGTATVILGWLSLKAVTTNLPSIDFEKVKLQAKRYIRFPMISLPADFLNMAAQQIPILMLSILFNPVIVGFFSLTQRALATPISFVSQSFLGVFQERASRDYNMYGNCRNIYIKTFKSLLFISIPPFIIFFFTAPWLFSFVFGKSWYVAGVYAQILSPLFFIRFTSSPLSYILYIAEKQNFDLMGQILLLLFSIGSIGIGGYYHNSFLSIICFSVTSSIIYILYLITAYYFAKGTK